ncbi:hypothetical protein [Streptomyces noursei]|uniref:hypothetical protein n=1 Tax=Streptomyces noursei TaxID=1971 RepID=UPI00045EF7C2|nr:hypothetical protein [Streptomyces noursei]AIA03464.1 hypothetical protein DC74_2964 [Streptomyces noursei]
MPSESRSSEELAPETELAPATELAIFRPSWVPETGHRSYGTGIEFDVVRIPGDRGAEVSEELITAARGIAGPILVRLKSSVQDTVFIVPRGTAEELQWPPGVFAHGTRWREYVAVPALRSCPTASMRWESRPTAEQEYVDPGVLYELVCRLTHWPGEQQ